MNDDHSDASVASEGEGSIAPTQRPLPLRTFWMALVSIGLLVLTVFYFTSYVNLHNQLGRSGDWLRNKIDNDHANDWNILRKSMSKYASVIGAKPLAAKDIELVSARP